MELFVYTVNLGIPATLRKSQKHTRAHTGRFLVTHMQLRLMNLRHSDQDLLGALEAEQEPHPQETGSRLGERRSADYKNNLLFFFSCGTSFLGRP